MPKIISISEAFSELTKGSHVDVIQFPNRGTGSVFGCVANLGQVLKLIRVFTNESEVSFDLTDVYANKTQSHESQKHTISLSLNTQVKPEHKHSTIQEEWFETGDILYISSTELMTKTMQESYDLAIGVAWRKHCPIVFNVLLNGLNLNESEEQQDLIKRYIDVSDIIIVNETDLPMLTGINDEHDAIKFLLRHVQTVVYTKSVHGSRVYTRAYQVSHSGVFVPKEEKATAHDVFVGAFLTQLLMNQVRGEIAIDKLKMYEILHFSTSQFFQLELAVDKTTDENVSLKKMQAI